NEKEIGEIFHSLHKTLKGTGHFFQDNQGKLDSIVDNVEGLSGDARETVAAARERYVDGPQVTRIMNNVERVSQSLGQELPPLLEDSRLLVKDGRNLVGALGSEEQIARYRSITRDVQDTAALAKLTASEAQSLVAH